MSYFSPPTISISDQKLPISRCQHAAGSSDGKIFMFGGRKNASGSRFKDLWSFDLKTHQWCELKIRGKIRPPSLQDHSLDVWCNKIFVFGGEVGHTNPDDTFVWIMDLFKMEWRRCCNETTLTGSTKTWPTGRRGHSSLVYRDSLYIFGGYQNLSGSLAELWIFNLIREEWSLVSSSKRQPAARHHHSVALYNDSMILFGGMSNLKDKNDVWQMDLQSRQWNKWKTNRGPDGLHSHTAVIYNDTMFVFGGESCGQLRNDLWRLNLVNRTWDKVIQTNIMPSPMSHHAAIFVPSISNDFVRRHHREKSEYKSVNKNNNRNATTSTTQSVVSRLSNRMHMTRKAIRYFKRHSNLSIDMCRRDSGITMSDDESDDTITNSSSKQKRSDKRSIDTGLELTELVATPIAPGPLIDEWPKIDELEWPDFGNKRHTVHESMSYYSLCFPSPQLGSVTKSRSLMKQSESKNRRSQAASSSATNYGQTGVKKTHTMKQAAVSPLAESSPAKTLTSEEQKAASPEGLDFSLNEFEEDDVLEFQRRSTHFKQSISTPVIRQMVTQPRLNVDRLAPDVAITPCMYVIGGRQEMTSQSHSNSITVWKLCFDSTTNSKK